MAPYHPDTPAVRADYQLYYDEITRLDKYVGLVLDELEAQGVTENTLVLFISDNGRPFPRDKTTLMIAESRLRGSFAGRRLSRQARLANVSSVRSTSQKPL